MREKQLARTELLRLIGDVEEGVNLGRKASAALFNHESRLRPASASLPCRSANRPVIFLLLSSLEEHALLRPDGCQLLLCRDCELVFCHHGILA